MVALACAQARGELERLTAALDRATSLITARDEQAALAVEELRQRRREADSALLNAQEAADRAVDAMALADADGHGRPITGVIFGGVMGVRYSDG